MFFGRLLCSAAAPSGSVPISQPLRCFCEVQTKTIFSSWHALGNGFLSFFAELENLGVAPWRKHARETANWVRLVSSGATGDARSTGEIAESILQDNLKFFGVSVDVLACGRCRFASGGTT